MTNDDFIGILDDQQLVPAAVVRQLREKIARGDARITPKSILKYLVKKELISREKAKQLLETTLIVTEKAESSILGLVPLPDMEAAAKAAREPKPAPVEEPAVTAA